MAIPNKLWNGKCRTDRYKICRLDTGLLAKNWTKNKFSGAAAAAEIDRRTGWGGLPFRFWGYGIEAVTAQWNSFGISFFYLLFFFFSFLSCEQLAIIGTLSAPNWWSFDKGNSPLSPFCSLTGSFCRAKMQHEMQSLWLMKFSKLHLLAFIDGFSMTNATWQQTLSQQVNRINVGQMQVVIRLVCCQIGIRILQDFKIVACYRLNLGIFKSFGFTYGNVKINLH